MANKAEAAVHDHSTATAGAIHFSSRTRNFLYYVQISTYIFLVTVRVLSLFSALVQCRDASTMRLLFSSALVKKI